MNEHANDCSDDGFLEYGDRWLQGDRREPMNRMEATFNRVMQTAPGMTRTEKDITWEAVMSAVNAPAMVPVSNRTRQRTTTMPRASRLASPRWAMIAITVVLMISGIAAALLQPNGVELPPTPTGQLAVAPQGLQATASPDTATCNLSRATLLVQGTDTRPAMMDQVMWLTSAGDLMLACGQDDAGSLLVSGVQSIQPTGAPNVISLVYQSEGGTPAASSTGGLPPTYPRTSYLNIATGQEIETDLASWNNASYQGSPNTFGSFQILATAEHPYQWSAVNLETMETRSLESLTGLRFPTSDSMTVDVSEDGQVMAVANSQYETEGSAILMRASGAEGDVAIISADFGTVAWLDVPGGLPRVNNFALSPDGSKIAFVAGMRGNDGTSRTVISVVEIATGEEIARSAEFTGFGGSVFTFVDDAIVYVADTGVYRLAFDGSEAATLLESSGSLLLAGRIRGTSTVHVIESGASQDERFHIINAATGTDTVIEGTSIIMGVTGGAQAWSYPQGPILCQINGELQIVDAVTGDVLTDATFAPAIAATPDTHLSPWTYVAPARSEPVTVLGNGDGELVLVDSTGNTSNVRTLPNAPADTGSMSISDDGTVLVWSETGAGATPGSWYTLDLTDPNATWQAGPEGSSVSLINGQ